ncbi:SDR family oxidoreductase [Pseudoalteromonas sp. SWN29]|uniref:SDR family NAD(P)-dependent oxidoreductase n=1 Tax=Pseudoalteromonas sp. SWN29 TaxID=2792064 RepID=UPI0018CD115D|nr:SDR family NAD(P)-dependent oxidoreductase [Pseudoalteromonas sp. SWN29]MBH0028982.1 SDR family oxidoreductase [Pseudoalteromonas sp. SWN29]
MTNTVTYTLITGANSGIGYATASNIVAQHKAVILVARSAEKLNMAKEQLLSSYPMAAILTEITDVSDSAQIKQLFSSISQQKINIEGLVHCAGDMLEAPLMMSRDTQIDQQYHIHLKAALLLCQGASKLMLRKKQGSIVLISSVVAEQGGSGQVVYASMKAAIKGLATSLAQELGSYNIRVNALAPGVIETPLVAHFDDEKKQQLSQRTALKRLGQAGDIAHVAAFLLSSQAAYITGQTIAVDGGLRL